MSLGGGGGQGPLRPPGYTPGFLIAFAVILQIFTLSCSKFQNRGCSNNDENVIGRLLQCLNIIKYNIMCI